MKKLAVAIAIIALLGLGYVYFPSVDTLVATVEWMKASGPVGALVFALVYGVATVMMLPASWTHATAGFLYGPIAGPIVASLLSTGFSALNFYLGRTLLRGWVEARVKTSPRFAAVDRLIGERGLFVVVMIRVPPVSPYNPMSYAMGASPVRFKDFVLGTWLGGLLPVTVWSSLGAQASNLAAVFNGEATGAGWLQWLGLAATLIASIIAGRFAKQALDAALKANEEGRVSDQI